MAEYLRHGTVIEFVLEKKLVKTLNRSVSLRSVKNRGKRIPKNFDGETTGRTGRHMGGSARETHGSVRAQSFLSFSLGVYIPGLYFSIVSRIATPAGADFAVRRHRPTAPTAAAAVAIRRKKGGQRYIQCLFIRRQIQWNLASRATTITGDLRARMLPNNPSSFSSSLFLFILSCCCALFKAHTFQLD